MRWALLLLLCVICSIVWVITFSGCQSALDRPIKFVIPDDFEGPMGILVNARYPDAINKNSDAYVITVPDDGLVLTRNVDIFYKWHEIESVDPTGKSVNDFYGGPSMTGSGIPGTIFWYYRGSKTERDEFMSGNS